MMQPQSPRLQTLAKKETAPIESVRRHQWQVHQKHSWLFWEIPWKLQILGSYTL